MVWFTKSTLQGAAWVCGWDFSRPYNFQKHRQRKPTLITVITHTSAGRAGPALSAYDVSFNPPGITFTLILQMRKLSLC